METSETMYDASHVSIQQFLTSSTLTFVPMPVSDYKGKVNIQPF